MNPHADLPIYADPVDLPDDPDLVTPAAATLNNAPASNLNRTAWLAEGAFFSALNWADGGPTTHNLKRAAWSSLDEAWFGVGDGGTNFLEASYSFGRLWVDLASTLPTAKTLVDVAVNASDGSVVLLTGTRDTYKGTRTAFGVYTFVLQLNGLTAAPSGGSLDYEPTAALLVACYRVALTGHRLDTSSDGVTWLNRTLPAPFVAYAGTNSPEVGATAGRVVAIFPTALSGTAKIETAYSTDGGITWTGVTLTSGITAADMATGVRITRPVYDATFVAWWFCISCTGTDMAEVWKSTNGGVTWTIAKTFTAKDVEAQAAALVGPVWAMLTKKGRLLISKDAGASWRWVACQDGIGANFTLRAGGGGAIVLNSASKTSMRSLRAGRVVGAAV